MTSFLIALAVLVGGYFIYGTLCCRIFGVDPSRKVPAETKFDGVDFVPLPAWKVFLIQFLNIAGLGPIFGAIMGIMFGPAAFIWIVAGTIFAGAVHDFMSGMMSLRSGGDSLPELVGRELGPSIKQTMRIVSVALLILVGAVFIINPADLLAGMTPDYLTTTVWIIAIFAYYVLATLLPIDKVIGNLYPLFGLALLFMAAGLLYVLLFGDVTIPDGFADGMFNRKADPDTYPIFPMMFISIACGAISGFHATQSPMMARCLKNENLGRPIFYGAMVAEGIVALIWAAAAIAFTGGYNQLAAYMAEHGNKPAALVNEISITWLGSFGGILALLGVIAAPITTGDTALRSARLIVADFLHIDQKKFVSRMAVSLPIFALCFAVMLIDYRMLWNYFAWINQTLSVFTLWAVTVYLARHNRFYFISLVPALFMTMVSVSFILTAKAPEGFGISLPVSLTCAGAVACLILSLFIRYVRLLRSGRLVHEVGY